MRAQKKVKPVKPVKPKHWMEGQEVLACVDITHDAEMAFVAKHGLELHETAQGPMIGITNEQYHELEDARRRCFNKVVASRME